jgi:hypothetical protein
VPPSSAKIRLESNRKSERVILIVPQIGGFVEVLSRSKKPRLQAKLSGPILYIKIAEKLPGSFAKLKILEEP